MLKHVEIPTVRYYLICGRTVGKRERTGQYRSKDWLFRDGEWVPDTGWVISDHLIGYDPSEPPDSPYAIGSTSVLMEIDEIPETEAMDLIRRQSK